MFQWGSAINQLGGTDTQPLLVVDGLVYSLLEQLFLEVFALALSHYSQSLESASNVVCSFTALPLELIQYNYNLGDCDCSTITPLYLLLDIHTCCPGSNGSRVAICSMICIKSFLTVGFPHCLFLTDNTSF